MISKEKSDLDRLVQEFAQAHQGSEASQASQVSEGIDPNNLPDPND